MSVRKKYQPGDRIGPYNILLLRRDHKNERGQWYSWFECPLCGKEFLTRQGRVGSGDTRSCGCLNNVDLTGKKFGHWTVLEKTDKKTKDRKFLWKCKCDCGNSKIYLVDTSSLKLGRSKSCGCVSSRGEETITKILSKNNISFEKEYSFDDCISPTTGHKLRFDFYLPDYNTCIEFDGIQHFQETRYSHARLKDIQMRDNIKNQYCKDNDINLIRIPYNEINNITIDMLLKGE